MEQVGKGGGPKIGGLAGVGGQPQAQGGTGYEDRGAARSWIGSGGGGGRKNTLAAHETRQGGNKGRPGTTHASAGARQRGGRVQANVRCGCGSAGGEARRQDTEMQGGRGVQGYGQKERGR